MPIVEIKDQLETLASEVALCCTENPRSISAGVNAPGDGHGVLGRENRLGEAHARKPENEQRTG